MRFLLGWAFKLAFVGLAWLVMTGNAQLKLPDTVLGYEVPPQARQWVARNVQLNDLANSTEARLRLVSDRLK